MTAIANQTKEDLVLGKVIGIREVAKILNISVSTIRRLERRGLFIRKLRIPGSIRIGYLSSDLQKYLLSLENNQNATALAFTSTWRRQKGSLNEK